ncbi:hypothetical protein ZOSMA_14G00940 [Zostera marina]|uniref:Uncharacterized protein n=1 Tax=Zostera marina TaxID=29655 RepID=A0A0K9PYM0_ZOSMR|nr:hypothetical protein ZOSMA_14G00940 [Zostera marina]
MSDNDDFESYHEGDFELNDNERNKIRKEKSIATIVILAILSIYHHQVNVGVIGNYWVVQVPHVQLYLMYNPLMKVC